MRQLAIFMTAALLTAGTTSTALAFIDGEVSVGKRSGTWAIDGTSKSISSTSIQMAGHIDPIPLIPVSFGLRLISESYNANMTDHSVKSLTSTAIVPEVTAWLPMGDLKPFARIGYTLLSPYKGTTEYDADADGTTSNVSVVYKSSGPRITAGIEYSLLPLISFLAAIEHSTETLKMTSGKAGAIDLTSVAKDIKFTSNAILVGAKVGI